LPSAPLFANTKGNTRLEYAPESRYYFIVELALEVYLDQSS